MNLNIYSETSRVPTINDYAQFIALVKKITVPILDGSKRLMRWWSK